MKRNELVKFRYRLKGHGGYLEVTSVEYSERLWQLYESSDVDALFDEFLKMLSPCGKYLAMRYSENSSRNIDSMSEEIGLTLLEVVLAPLVHSRIV